MHTNHEHGEPEAEAADLAMQSIRRIARAAGRAARGTARKPGLTASSRAAWAPGEAFRRRFEELADWEQMHLLAALQRVGTMMEPQEQANPKPAGRYETDAPGGGDDLGGGASDPWRV